MEERVPEIRFKGFDGPWKKRQIVNVAERLDNLRIPVSENMRKKGTVPYYGANGIQDYVEGYTHDGENVLVAEDGANDLKNYPVRCVKGKIWVNNHAHVLQGKPDIANNQFLALAIHQSDIESLLVGGGRAKLNAEVLMKLETEFPVIKEQIIIGEYFTLFDTLITLTQQKLDQLKKLKKACLEKMFPKEGETVPEIRFKGFEGPWEWKKLGGIADIVGGGTPSTSIPEYWSGNISWYSPAEIGNKVFVSESQRKITKAGYNHCSANILPPGTVLFTSRAGIGKTAILEKEGCTNQGFQSIIPHKEQLDSYFIYSRTAELKQYGETVGAGSTFVEVSGKQMADMDILIPAILEQQVIGGYFRNLDNLISIIQQKLDQLKNLKKALLDRMFV